MSSEPTDPEDDLLERILSEGSAVPARVTPDWERANPGDWLRDLVRRFVGPGGRADLQTRQRIEALVRALDEKLSLQVDEILHAPSFQKLEASWSGLHHLVFNCPSDEKLEIWVWNAGKSELVIDLERATELESSALCQRVYDQGWTTAGTLFGLLVGDYEFSNSTEDLNLLQRISYVAAAAHAPFVAAARAELLGLETLRNLHQAADLARAIGRPEFARWRSFRDSEDSRYVALTLPRVLARLPYGPDTKPVEAFDYRERVVSGDDYSWSCAAYAFATRVADSFVATGWFMHIRGMNNGGLVEGLPVHRRRDADGELEQIGPTEIAVSDRCQAELSDLGLLPILAIKGRDAAVFFDVSSCQNAKVYDTELATTAAKLSTKLNFLLSASRVAHYLRAILRERDELSWTWDQEEWEAFLNRSIRLYVDRRPDEEDLRSGGTPPFAAARIHLKELPERPGAYEAWLEVQPRGAGDGFIRLAVSFRAPRK